MNKAMRTYFKKKAGGIYVQCPSQTRPDKVLCQACSDLIVSNQLRRYHTDIVIGKIPAKIAYRNRQKKRIIDHYGPVCKQCLEDKIQFLTLDHINNDGATRRKLNNESTGHTLYNRLIKNNFPDGYQVLCWNCNFKKSRIIQSINLSSNVASIRNRQSKLKLRLQILSAYGGTCKCCGVDDLTILTIDHINNNGNEHRKIISDSRDLCRWIRNHHYPPDYQILCHNCNCGRAINNGICPHKTGQL